MMYRFLFVVALTAVLFGLSSPLVSAQAVTNTTATVSSPADNSQVYAVEYPGIPPQPDRVYADIDVSSTHTWSITGANPNQTFSVSYSCTLDANGIQKDQYYNPSLDSGFTWTGAIANSSGEWWATPKTLSGNFKPGPRPSTPYPVTAYTEISTSTIAGDSATDTNNVTVLPPQ